MQDAFSEEFEKVEIDLFGVGVVFLVNAHEKVLYVDDDPQETVQLCVGNS